MLEGLNNNQILEWMAFYNIEIEDQEEARKKAFLESEIQRKKLQHGKK